MNRPGLEIGINKDPISIIWNIKQILNTNVTVSLRDEFNRNKETETSKNKRIPKTDGRSMKYRKTGNGIISTFVKLSFLSMSDHTFISYLITSSKNTSLVMPALLSKKEEREEPVFKVL